MDNKHPDNKSRSQDGTDRLKSKRENAELAIGSSIAFMLFLLGINTNNILYTIGSIIVFGITINRYENN